MPSSFICSPLISGPLWNKTQIEKKTRMRSNDYDDGDGNNDGDCDGDSDSNNDNLLQFFCFTNFIFVLLFTARCKAALFEWTSWNSYIVVVSLIINEEFDNVVCHKNQIKPEQNCFFVIQKSSLNHQKDVFSYDIGRWERSRIKHLKYGESFDNSIEKVLDENEE